MTAAGKPPETRTPRRVAEGVLGVPFGLVSPAPE